MGDFTVVRAASLTLKSLLTTYITNSPNPELSGTAIDLRSPREMKDASNAMGVSLWLYRVRRMPELVNIPEPRQGPDLIPREAIRLELGYLVTPVQDDPEVRHTLLGRIVQVFNDWSTIEGADLADTLLGTDEKLHVHFDVDTAEPDPMGIWHALHMSYQPSLPYLVQYVTVESDRPPIQGGPVLRREATTGEMLGVGG